MELSSRAWLATLCVLCRKSTDLSWEGEEPDAAAVEEDPPAAIEESASLPQAETVAPCAEATLPEATVVEGMYTAMMPLPRVVVVAPSTHDVCLMLKDRSKGPQSPKPCRLKASCLKPKCSREQLSSRRSQ
jgi:hypothetical protein